MIRTITTLAALAALFMAAQAAPAQILQFDLMGSGGMGLLGSNVAPIPVAGGGSGGELGTGITFNIATNQLTLNVGWGSGNGFANLTGNAQTGHIHGPTSNPAPASFTQAVGVRYNVHTEPGFNSSGISGGFNGVLNILPVDVAGLFQGRFYFDVHTGTNPGGEIRGQLVPIPEPSMMLAGLCAAGGAMLRGRFRKR